MKLSFNPECQPLLLSYLCLPKASSLLSLFAKSPTSRPWVAEAVCILIKNLASVSSSNVSSRKVWSCCVNLRLLRLFVWKSFFYSVQAQQSVISITKLSTLQKCKKYQQLVSIVYWKEMISFLPPPPPENSCDFGCNLGYNINYDNYDRISLS